MGEGTLPVDDEMLFSGIEFGPFPSFLPCRATSLFSFADKEETHCICKEGLSWGKSLPATQDYGDYFILLYYVVLYVVPIQVACFWGGRCFLFRSVD